MQNDIWALALHGGAGAIQARSYAQEEEHMRALMEEGAAQLAAGVSALDVVTAMVAELEASGLHVAGKGAGPNTEGRYELDASIMDGATRAAGAVSALQGFASPVRVARKVMETTPHVMLTGDGAASFAKTSGCEAIGAPELYYKPARSGVPPSDRQTGTVGAVARDKNGRLAAATSTGGVRNKLPGRVGDSPIIGAGCWADSGVAVSCTGIGEYFIRVAAAHDLAARVAYAQRSLENAGDDVLGAIKAMGGDGGLIAVSANGDVITPFVSQGMKRAIATSAGLRTVATFE